MEYTIFQVILSTHIVSRLIPEDSLPVLSEQLSQVADKCSSLISGEGKKVCRNALITKSAHKNAPNIRVKLRVACVPNSLSSYQSTTPIITE